MTQAGGQTALKRIVNELEAGSEMTFIGLGDSLTYGWEANAGYYDRFIDKLRARYTAATVNSINAGVSGETAAEGQRRLPVLLENSPDVVTVQFGINDSYAGVPLKEYADAMANIAKEIIIKESVPVFVVSCPIVQQEEHSRVNEYYNIMRSLGREFDVLVADLAEYWQKNQDKSKQLYFEDGVHPTDDGYALMAAGLFESFSLRMR